MLNIGTANTKAFLKFNAKAGRYYFGGDQEITRPVFTIDLKNIVTGVFRFKEASAPERRIDPSHDRIVPCPDKTYKRGFMAMLYSPDHFGGAAEFCSTSALVGDSVRELHKLYVQQRDAHPEQLPVVESYSLEEKKTQHGVNYKPLFRILKWIDRPAELPDQLPVDQSEIWTADLLITAPQLRPQLVTPRQPVVDALQPEF